MEICSVEANFLDLRDVFPVLIVQSLESHNQLCFQLNYMNFPSTCQYYYRYSLGNRNMYSHSPIYECNTDFGDLSILPSMTSIQRSYYVGSLSCILEMTYQMNHSIVDLFLHLSSS